jgi:hypothetical protein
MLESLLALCGKRKPRLVPVHAVESDGINCLPATFAAALGGRLRLDVEAGIVQANVVAHTGADEWQRIVRPALFDGEVEAGRDYVVLDDFVGQGGTLANLRGHVLAGGGRVIAAAALAGRKGGATLAVQPGTLTALRTRYETIEETWRQTFGYRFDCLTEQEAQGLLRLKNAGSLRARLATARSRQDD